MAYINGRSDKNPVDGWYNGELWFFDNYIIPLGKKLDQCQVFGVSSHEYLDYAMQNRDEWEVKGNRQVEQWKALLAEKYHKQRVSDLSGQAPPGPPIEQV